MNTPQRAQRKSYRDKLLAYFAVRNKITSEKTIMQKKPHFRNGAFFVCLKINSFVYHLVRMSVRSVKNLSERPVSNCTFSRSITVL